MPVKQRQYTYHGEHGVEIRWYDELLEYAVNQGFKDVRAMLTYKHRIRHMTLVEIGKELKRCPEGVGDLLRKFGIPINKNGGQRPNPDKVYMVEPCPKCGGVWRYKRNNLCRRCESLRGAKYRERKKNGHVFDTKISQAV